MNNNRIRLEGCTNTSHSKESYKSLFISIFPSQYPPCWVRQRKKSLGFQSSSDWKVTPRNQNRFATELLSPFEFYCALQVNDLNISEAFDKIWHAALFNKFSPHCLPQQLSIWIKACYLTGLLQFATSFLTCMRHPICWPGFLKKISFNFMCKVS